MATAVRQSGKTSNVCPRVFPGREGDVDLMVLPFDPYFSIFINEGDFDESRICLRRGDRAQRPHQITKIKGVNSHHA
jgi:hypothetical protein